MVPRRYQQGWEQLIQAYRAQLRRLRHFAEAPNLPSTFSIARNVYCGGESSNERSAVTDDRRRELRVLSGARGEGPWPLGLGAGSTFLRLFLGEQQARVLKV